METRTVGDPTTPTLLVVFGYGNRLDNPDETWFLDQLSTDYHVHAVALPTTVADFEAEYVGPLQRVHDRVAPTAIVGHSLGGLVAAHLRTDAARVYLSPWWGLPAAKVTRLERWLVPRLPISWPILPTKTRREELGAALSDAGWAAVPKRVAPTTITAIEAGMQTRPPIDADAVVFTTLADTIVSHAAIADAVTSDQIELYDGGHQLFSTADRDAHLDRVAAALP